MLTGKNIGFMAGKKKLLEDISVQFQPGIINLILGPNGAGKTTLLKILAGQLNGYTGDVFYEDRNLKQLSIRELAKSRALLSQHTELAFPLRVEEVVMMGRYPHFTTNPSKRDIEAVEEAISLFNLHELRTRNYLTLSGGEKQRVHFARVIAQIWYPVEGSRSFLLLDEPLSFLDIFFQHDFMNKVISLMESKKLVVAGIIHDLQLAARYAGHAIILQQGKIIAAGGKEAIFTKDLLKKAYNVEVEVENRNGTPRLFF